MSVEENVTVNETKKQPWLLVLMRAQFNNKAAEAMGKAPWWVMALCIVIATVLSAFPMVNDSFVSAFENSDPSRYPGLLDAFNWLRTSGAELRIQEGNLTVNQEVLGPYVAYGSWMILSEPSGANLQTWFDQQGDATGSVVQPILFLGKKYLGVIDQTSGSQLEGSWELLDGLDLASTSEYPIEEVVDMILYTTATAALPRTYLSVLSMMFIQLVFMGVLLGFLLSLSRVQALGSSIGAKRKVGFVSSLKTTFAVATGPALLLAVVLFNLRGAGQLGYVLFSILFAGRIVLLYMGRFKNKKLPGKKGQGPTA